MKMFFELWIWNLMPELGTDWFFNFFILNLEINLLWNEMHF